MDFPIHIDTIQYDLVNFVLYNAYQCTMTFLNIQTQTILTTNKDLTNLHTFKKGSFVLLYSNSNNTNATQMNLMNGLQL